MKDIQTSSDEGEGGISREVLKVHFSLTVQDIHLYV
jgi:hypothetical protein